MQLDPESIPEELRSTPHWVVWRWVTREGKRTKPPFDANSNRPGDATDPRLWMPFGDALSWLNQFDGVGFAVQDTPYTGIDLDHCLDGEGNLAPWAEIIVSRFDSYTEITPSGNGLRVWVRGKLPPGRRRKGSVEMYDGGRYFTVTGRHLRGSPVEIRERGEELAAFHGEIFGEESEHSQEASRPVPPSSPLSLTDEEILRRAMGARNGDAFSALFRGDISAYDGDESRADLALCSKLAFWFGGDVDAIDRVFRRSGLYRDKWDREDYRDRTISKALERTAFYDPVAFRNGDHPRGESRNGDANGAHPPPGANGNGHGGRNGDGAPPHVAAPDQPRPVEGVADPHRLARLFLEQPPTHPDGPTIVAWKEEWHRWNGQAWRTCPDGEVNAELNRCIKREFDRLAMLAGREAQQVTTRMVSNVAAALRSIVLLKSDDYPQQPAWIGDREPGEDLPVPSEILPTSNALVHLPSYLAGEPCILPPSPRFFSANSLGYSFEPNGGDPAELSRFLGSIWPDDPESIACLQEWMGYLLMPDSSQQKILMLIGPKRSGKGTIVRLIRALVGNDNVAAPTLSGLTTNFGLSPLIGKTVALIADARLSGRADSQVIVERLLAISGEDAQTIDRKHREQWTGKLAARIVLVSNELPRLGDSSGALPSRMILLQMTRSFYGQEDTTLTDKLLAERPAILRWAIAGWARLRERGHFTQPKSGAELAEDLHDLSSPIGAFVEECCVLGENCGVLVKDLYDAWKRFCADRGKEHPGDEQGFGRNLRAAVPTLKVIRPTEGGKRVRKYEGIGLRIGY